MEALLGIEPKPLAYKASAQAFELQSRGKTVVSVEGLEPPQGETLLDPKSSASANSATPTLEAFYGLLERRSEVVLYKSHFQGKWRVHLFKIFLQFWAGIQRI